jgi:hypothetical protein
MDLNSPDAPVKLAQRSPTVDDDHDQWSGDGSSGDENRSQSGAAKRKRPLSVSCETCKARKVSLFRQWGSLYLPQFALTVLLGEVRPWTARLRMVS